MKRVLDSYRVVQQLENSGLSRKQSTNLMYCMNGLLTNEIQRMNESMIQKVDSEKETFEYRASLHNLKRELGALRKTETVNLQSAVTQLTREVDVISFKFREDLNEVKSDIQLEMNNRKFELRQEAQKIEMQLQELDHFCKISMGEIKTKVEQMKLELISKYATGFALGTTCIVFGVLRFL